MSSRKIGSFCILAGILLFVLDSGACFYRMAAADHRHMVGLPAGPERFAWEFWPDPCVIWFWLVVIGVAWRIAGRNVPAEQRAPITHEVALVYHLFPEETGFVTEQGGSFSDLVPQVAAGLQRLPLPQQEFPAPVVYLKIRPAQDAKPKLASAFFESLHRAVTAPILFDLVAEQGSVYFQMACVPADQPVIEQQLALYFPGCDIEPHTPDFSEMILMAHCRYPHALGNKKTLAGFALDPYAPLFALLDQLADTDGLLISVKCIPIREATMLTALQYADQQVSGQQTIGQKITQDAKDAAAAKIPVAGAIYGGYRQGTAERIRNVQRMLPSVIGELTTKLPAWGMRVDVSFAYDEADPFGDALAHFFAQYETAECKWIDNDGPDEWQRCLRFETKYINLALPYCVVACDELAAVAHFPGGATSCERLERAGAASGLPPALYLE